MTLPRRTQLALVGWGALTFAALLASFSVFRPVRDALVLDGNPESIPALFLGTFLAVSVASPLWSWLLARHPRRRVVPVAFHVFAVGALVFATLVYQRVAPVSVGRAFYIWSSVYNLFVVSVFWSLLADLIGPTNASTLFGPIAAGGTIGTLVGPALTKLLVATIDVPGVLVLSAVLLQVAAFGVHRLRLLGDALEPPPPPGSEPPSSPFTGLSRVARSPYLIAICGYVLCTATAATFLYLDQAVIVKAALADRVARTEFFASLDLYTAAATLVLQTLVAGWLLRRLGPGPVLCILPLAQLGAQWLLDLDSSTTMLAIAMVTTRAATHGLTRPSRELLFTVVTREDKYHAKNVIDTIVYRFGDLGSSWLYTGIVALGWGSMALAILSVPLAGVWVTLAVGLGLRFRQQRAATAAADAAERPPAEA